MKQTLSDLFLQKSNRYYSADGLLNEQGEVKASVPLLADAHTRFKAVIAKIPVEAGGRMTFKTAYAGVKPATREEAGHQAFLTVKALMAVGRKEKITELLNLPHTTESDIATMRYEDLGNYLLALKDLVTKYALELPEAGYTEARTTAFTNTVIGYNAAIKESDIAKGKGEASTEKIDGIFEEADNIFLEIVDLIESLQDEYPDLYTNFKHVAQLREYGVRHQETPAAPETPVN